MRKSRAIELLGGTVAAAAKEIGVSYQAIDKWPDDLPKRIADRVLAALARKHLPRELIGDDAVPAEGPRVGFADMPSSVQQRAVAAGEG